MDEVPFSANQECIFKCQLTLPKAINLSVSFSLDWAQKKKKKFTFRCTELLFPILHKMSSQMIQIYWCVVW